MNNNNTDKIQRDAVILMLNSACGLQNQLNILCNAANRVGLVVSLDKSDIDRYV